MKILVFADFHGSVAALDRAVAISVRERPDKTVVCGDIFGWSSVGEVVGQLSRLCGVKYFIRGNNDWQTAVDLLPEGMEDSAVMYHFGRTLFFTHGDRYNGGHIPPLLKENDALVFGHSHMASLRKQDGLFLLNVGSLARPRDDVPSYMLLDDVGAAIKTVDGQVLACINWER